MQNGNSINARYRTTLLINAMSLLYLLKVIAIVRDNKGMKTHMNFVNAWYESDHGSTLPRPQSLQHRQRQQGGSSHQAQGCTASSWTGHMPPGWPSWSTRSPNIKQQKNLTFTCTILPTTVEPVKAILSTYQDFKQKFLIVEFISSCCRIR